jgi:hypothetical protein
MTNSKNPGDAAAAALSRAVDHLCEAVRVAIAAGLLDAAVTSRTRRVTRSVARQLSARRRAQRAAALDQMILKRNQQADIRERQARLIAERNAREREAIRMHELRTELIAIAGIGTAAAGGLKKGPGPASPLGDIVFFGIITLVGVFLQRDDRLVAGRQQRLCQFPQLPQRNPFSLSMRCEKRLVPFSKKVRSLIDPARLSLLRVKNGC